MVEPWKLYIGTSSVRGSKGIYVLRMDRETGALTLHSTAQTEDPTFLCASPDGKHLYSSVECMIYAGAANAATVSFAVQPDGSLEKQNWQPVAGQLNSHVSMSADGRFVYASSYITGTLTRYAVAADGSLGAPECVVRHVSPDERPPLLHAAFPTPDGRYVCTIETGLDYISMVDSVSLNEEYRLDFPPQSRVRHLAFHPFNPSLLYVLTEFGNEVWTVRYEPDSKEKLTVLQRLPNLDRVDGTFRLTSAIKTTPDGKLLLTSLRAFENEADLLNTYAIGPDGLLTLAERIRPAGRVPRDLAVTPDGRFAVVASQWSDTVDVYRIDAEKGSLHPTGCRLPVACPNCVLFLPRQG